MCACPEVLQWSQVKLNVCLMQEVNGSPAVDFIYFMILSDGGSGTYLDNHLVSLVTEEETTTEQLQCLQSYMYCSPFHTACPRFIDAPLFCIKGTNPEPGGHCCFTIRVVIA